MYDVNEYFVSVARSFAKKSEEKAKERKKDIKWMMTVVNDVLGNDDLCRGCEDGEERTCDECRRIVADRVLNILADLLE